MMVVVDMVNTAYCSVGGTAVDVTASGTALGPPASLYTFQL